jgi:hypothetical protein
MPFVETVDDEPIYLSEDWAFTSRARKLGFSAWLEPTVQVGHRLDFTVTAATMKKYFQMFGETW